MNLIAKKNNIQFIDYNQDATCMSVGLSKGFKVYNIQPKFTEIHAHQMGSVGICEMLFSSSLIAIAGSGDDPAMSPRKLNILNTKNKSTICELNFVTPILAVKMNKKRLIVVLETKIHIYDISTMKILQTLDTCPNPKGIVALAAADDNCYLAYPYSNERGDIVIFDALSLQMLNVIHSHKTPLTKLAINYNGTYIASASTKGTVIRVHSIPDASKIYQFRRGSYPANVHSVSFSPDSSLLCVSSETGTVHIFKIDQSSLSTSSDSKQQAPATSGLASFYSSYIPTTITDMWETIPARSFASTKLASGAENLCAIAANNSSVMIVMEDGVFYQFSMDPKNGGELKLSAEHRITSFKPDDEIGIVNTVLS